MRDISKGVATENGFIALGKLGQAEIENFRMAALGDKNICRIDIAMNDAVGVSGVEGVGNSIASRQQSFCVHRPARDAMLQRQPFQKLHGDEGLAVLLADVVDRTNIWMVECGCGLRFAFESALALGGHGQPHRAGT